MNAQQITTEILEKVNFTSLYVPKEREHINVLIRLGRIFPTTKAQAKKVYSQSSSLEILYNSDVEKLIEPLLNKHGLKGEYKLTKSKRNCRLINFEDFRKALKIEFQF